MEGGCFNFANKKKVTFFSRSFSLGSCWESGSCYELYFSCDCWILYFAFWETFHVLVPFFFFNICKTIAWNDFKKIFPELSAKNVSNFPTLYSYRSFFRTDELLRCPRTGLYIQKNSAAFGVYSFILFWHFYKKQIHYTPYCFHAVII